jgi:hypothetical protein
MKTLRVVLLLLLPVAAFSQIGKKGSTNVSAGADFLLPSSSFATTHNFGLGLTLKGEYVFAQHVSATVSGSFYHFTEDAATHLNAIPLLGGLRYYLGNFYLGAEAGAVFQIHPSGSSALAYSFSVGDELFTSGGNSLDISVRVQNWNTDAMRRFYGVRVAYEFRIR